MNKETVNEKYKDEKLTFTDYYKYVFTFSGRAEDGNTISCEYGGDHNNIYRYSVSATEEVPFNFVQNWMSVTVTSPTGEKLFEWYDW